MAFPFSSWFKGKQPDAGEESAPAETQAPEPVAMPLPAAPPVGVRQTQPVNRPQIRSVMPHAAQPSGHREASPRPPVPLGTKPPTALTAGPAPKVSPSMPTARKISFGGTSSPAGLAAPITTSIPASLPVAPKAAPAEQPVTTPVFTVTLTIGDFIDRLPPGLVKPGNHPRDQSVEFSSTELYSDLAKGRASVPASVIYEKCPSIFVRPISETEDAEVQLPLPKIVEQMSAALQTRSDQVSEESAVEIETPFLHVANEDNARLPRANGTTVGALPSSDLPSGSNGARSQPHVPDELPSSVSRGGVRHTGQVSTISPIKAPAESTPVFAPPTAASAGAINQGKRPPSTVRASVAGSKIRVSGPSTPARSIVPAPHQPASPGGAVPTGDGQEAASTPSAPAVNSAASSPSHQVAKKTARIQIPPISLRTAGAGTNGVRPPVAFTPPAAAPTAVPPPSFRAAPSSQPQMPNFRPAPPAAPGASVFRSSPPPAPAPPSTKRVPASFAPTVRPSFPPPAFPAAPLAPVSPAASEPPSSAPLPPPAPAPVSNLKIDLSLIAILRGLPASDLSDSISSVSDHARILLPFAQIEKQLSQGRVNVPRSVFVEALPEEHRGILANDAAGDEIPIPLQEVFQNLPSNALSIRADQVVEETTYIYPTPFSQKADEDAARLGFVEPIKPASSLAAEPDSTLDEPESALAAPEADAIEIDAEPSADRAHEARMGEAAAPEIADGSTTKATPPEFSTQGWASENAPSTHTANLIDTEEASADAEAPLAVEIPAVESVAQDFPLTEELFQETPLPELPSLPPAPLVDRTEIEAAHTEQADAPVEIRSLAEPPSIIPQDPILDHGGQASTDAGAVLPTLPLPAIPIEATVSLSQPEALAGDDRSLAEAGALAFPAPRAIEPAFDTVETTAALPAIPVVTSQTSPVRLVDVQPTDTVLQTLFMTEDEMDAKTIVKHINQLPGVNGCAIMFGDGLPLAGNFPDGNEKAGFSAMAPPFFKRTLTFTDELKLGGLEAFTLYTDHGLLSFFMHGDICLSVRHAGRGFLPGVREKLNCVTQELAKIYSSEKPFSTSH